MSYQDTVTVRFTLNSLPLNRTYEAVKVGGRLTLYKALKLLGEEFQQLGPKNITVVAHGPESRPYPKGSVAAAAASALRLTLSEIRFFKKPDDPDQLFFLCPRCGQEMDLLNHYLTLPDLTPQWQIRTDLQVTCPRCGTDLGKSVTHALNGMAGLLSWLTPSLHDQDEAGWLSRVYTHLQTGMNDLLGELGKSNPQGVEIVRNYFGAWRTSGEGRLAIAKRSDLREERVKMILDDCLKMLRRLVQDYYPPLSLTLLVNLLEHEIRTLREQNERLQYQIEELRSRSSRADVDPSDSQS